MLDYWRNPDRERKLFFCQIEALETAIYVTEVANKYGDAWIENELRHFNEDANPHYYRQRDIVNAEQQIQLGSARILITNFHAFKQRELEDASRLTKSILSKGEAGLFTETPDQMVRRVCRELGNKKNIIVINDEAYHCYRRRAGEEEVKLSGDERKEAEKREEEKSEMTQGNRVPSDKAGAWPAAFVLANAD